jgi:hypothetical protein
MSGNSVNWKGLAYDTAVNSLTAALGAKVLSLPCPLICGVITGTDIALADYCVDRFLPPKEAEGLLNKVIVRIVMKLFIATVANAVMFTVLNRTEYYPPIPLKVSCALPAVFLGTCVVAALISLSHFQNEGVDERCQGLNTIQHTGHFFAFVVMEKFAEPVLKWLKEGSSPFR